MLSFQSRKLYGAGNYHKTIFKLLIVMSLKVLITILIEVSIKLLTKIFLLLKNGLLKIKGILSYKRGQKDISYFHGTSAPTEKCAF